MPSANHRWNDAAMIAAQQRVALARSVACVPTLGTMRVGVSRSLFDEGLPINGLRHPVVRDLCGWFIYGGEAPMSDDDDYFNVFHAAHLPAKLTPVFALLGLPPGYRFLWADDYLDVWYDANLLDV